MYRVAIDTDIPLAAYPVKFADLKGRVDAAFAALADIGKDVPVSDADIATARRAVVGAPTTEVMLSSPGTIVHIKAILAEYDKQVVQSAAQIRAYVTNRLIVESTDKDPRVRMRALELLGKISDVGLFTEKTEVTMRHRPTEELEQMLRERLAKVISDDSLPNARMVSAATEAVDVDPISLLPDASKLAPKPTPPTPAPT